MFATPSQAANIVIGGTTYNVQFFDAETDGSFDTINTNNANVLTTPATVPWFGNAGFANVFGSVYTGLARPYEFDSNANQSGDEFLYFGYSVAGGVVNVYRLSDAGGVPVATTISSSDTSASTNWAYISLPVPTPEINADALIKALFALFVLGLWLTAVRGRQV